MNFETLKLALRTLLDRKLRSFLTILGVVIAIVSIIAISAIISGLDGVVSSQVQSLGSNIVTVTRLSGFNQRLTEEQRQRKELTLEDADAIRQEARNVDMVTCVMAMDFTANPNIRYNGVHANSVKVFGVEPDYINVYTSYVHSGRFHTEADVEHRTHNVVLGATVAEAMFGNIDPVGKDIYFENDSFHVIGTLERRGSIFGFDRDNFIWIPVTTMLKLHPESKYNLTIAMRATTQDGIPRVIDQVTEIMRRRRHVAFDKPNSFDVGSQNQFIDFYKQLTGGLYLAMLVIASIALMVGGIGVMNIMLVSVTERTKEIGVRKAIGARRRHILSQFLMEACMLTGLGGIIGIILGEGVSLLVDAFSPVPSHVGVGLMLVAFTVAVSVGLFFGIYPAARASKLDPIEALRFE